MSTKIDVDQNKDHIGGNFEWDVDPKCSCGKIKKAVDDRFLFVSNYVGDEFNSFYILPVDADGYLFNSSGVPITHCPWCGDAIRGKKKYVP